MILRILTTTTLSLTLMGACSTRGSEGDSETHWLIGCATDTDCGAGAACLCGTCTTECSPGASCADGPEGSSCARAATAPQCEGASTRPGGLCLVECAADADCPNDLRCAQSTCVEPAPGPSIPNPTGSCIAATGGARAGYSVPERGDVWLPDCANPLNREYWRVYAKSPTSAYVLPRLDGALELTASPCQTDIHPLRALVDRYGLCTPATSTEQVDRVNDMDPADALAITRYMHTQLVFEVMEGVPGAAVRPFPIPSDVLAACALHPGTNSTELQTVCEAEQQYVESGIDIGRTYLSVAGELPQLLNELYGIGQDCPTGETPGRVCLACGVIGGCGQTEVLCTKFCQSSAECAGVSAGEYCMLQRCGAVTGCI